MPFTGFALAKLLELKPLLAAGVVPVGSCPGGTASNVITCFARGDVPLSVTMTSVSTIFYPVFNPLFTYLFARQWIFVPVIKLFISTVEIILLPVVIGLGIRGLFKEKVDTVSQILPMVSSITIIFIVGVIVAAKAESLREMGLRTGIAVLLHNLIELFLAFYISRLFMMEVAKAHAVSIEVGMQNSGLGVALERSHFGVLAALPSAMFGIWHNISGPALEWWWRRSDVRKKIDG